MPPNPAQDELEILGDSGKFLRIFWKFLQILVELLRVQKARRFEAM